MRHLKIKILSNEKLTDSFYKMRLESPYLAANTRPGQFLEVRCSDDIIPLLRKPFSCHKVTKNGIEILYEVIGTGTEILSSKKKGGDLDVIGPLGNGFDIECSTIHERRLSAEARSAKADYAALIICVTTLL